MDDKPVFLTVEGMAKLESELDHLRRIRRSEIASRINEAQEVGGFGDNADLDDARNEQAFVEARIQSLERMLRNAKIIKEGAGDTSVVHIGSKVTVMTSDGDSETYTIVGSAEANPRQGRISNESPVGQALLGRAIGDTVQVMTPAGPISLRVDAIA